MKIYSCFIFLFAIQILSGMGDSSNPEKLESFDIKVVSTAADVTRLTSFGQRWAFGLRRPTNEQIDDLCDAVKGEFPEDQEFQNSLRRLHDHGNGSLFLMNKDKQTEMSAIAKPAFGTPHGIWIDPKQLQGLPAEIAAHELGIAEIQTGQLNYDFRKFFLYNGMLIATGESIAHFIKQKIEQGKTAITPKQLKWARTAWYCVSPVGLSYLPLEKTIASALYSNNAQQLLTSAGQTHNIARHCEHSLQCLSQSDPHYHTKRAALEAKRDLYQTLAAERTTQEKVQAEQHAAALQKIETFAVTQHIDPDTFKECVITTAGKQFGTESAIDSVLATPHRAEPVFSKCKKECRQHRRRDSFVPEEASIK